MDMSRSIDHRPVNDRPGGVGRTPLERRPLATDRPTTEIPTSRPEADTGFLRRHRAVISVGTLATLIAAGVLIGERVKGGGDNDHSLLPSDTNNSAPLTPGETTPSTTEAVTADTVKFQSEGETIVSVKEFYAQTGVFEVNDPKLPAPTPAEGLEIWQEYVDAIETVANVETDPEGEQFKKEATDKILFTEGGAGPLAEFVADVQAKKARIVGAEDVALTGAPEKAYPAQGQATFTVQYPDGTVELMRVTAATVNDSGIIRNAPGVSTVAQVTT